MIARRRAVATLTAGCWLGIYLGIAAAPAAAAPVYATRATAPGILHLQTVPALARVVVQVDGATARSDADGRIKVPVRNFVGLAQRLRVPDSQVSPDRKVVLDRFRGNPDHGVSGGAIEIGVRTSRLVSWRFLDRADGEMPIAKVHSMRLRSNTGAIFDLSGAQLSQPLWVPESRTQQGPAGLVSKQLYYVVDSVVVGGTSVVNRAQQRFVPWEQQQWLIQLLFFKVAFTSTDLLFAGQVGKGIELTRPDGSTQRLPFGRDGTAVVPDLPRGTYTVKAYGGGLSFARPVSISKDQEVSLAIVSRLDLALIGSTVLAVALGLVLLGRPQLRAWCRQLPRHWRRRSRGGRATPHADPRGTAVLGLLLLGVLVGAQVRVPPASAAEGPKPVPVLAYYYIWFNPSSWNRAKVDYPVLGRYSSDDEEIMRRHVRMAKAAGIDGFLVSWKHTPQLDERLAKLVSVARAEAFHLGIVYQGLDFARQPLPLDTVRADLTLFANEYAGDPVFDIFGKPIVVWTGSGLFSRAQIDDTVRGVREKLLVLGAAKSVEDCERMAPAVDGQAYYWSSVDPVSGTSRTKLPAMGRAVHRTGGLWIAPAAPGFDARLVGGTQAVPRRDGETLRQSLAAARSSEPDAIGVISWNEFSENTHIEPSQRYGSIDLNVLADLLGAGADITVPGDSSDVAGSPRGLTTWGALLLMGGATALLPVAVAVWRRRAPAAADLPPRKVGRTPGEGRA